MPSLKKVGFHIRLPGHITYLLFERDSSSLEINQENGEICPCCSLNKTWLCDWKGKVQNEKEYVLFILSRCSNCRKFVHAEDLMVSEPHASDSTQIALLVTVKMAPLLSSCGRNVGSGNIISSYFVLACGHWSSIDTDGILKFSLWMKSVIR